MDFNKGRISYFFWVNIDFCNCQEVYWKLNLRWERYYSGPQLKRLASPKSHPKSVGIFLLNSWLQGASIWGLFLEELGLNGVLCDIFSRGRSACLLSFINSICVLSRVGLLGLAGFEGQKGRGIMVGFLLPPVSGQFDCSCWVIVNMFG